MKAHRFLAFFFVFLSLFSTTSCKKDNVVYVDSLPATELAEEACDDLETTDFRVAPRDWLSDYVTLPDGINDYEICFSSDGSNLSEFGIFHVNPDQIAPLEATLHTYLAESLSRNREFYNSYIPQETPKLEKAEIRVFGNYVCYAILSESDKSTFFATIREELTEKE